MDPNVAPFLFKEYSSPEVTYFTGAGMMSPGPEMADADGMRAISVTTISKVFFIKAIFCLSKHS